MNVEIDNYVDNVIDQNVDNVDGWCLIRLNTMEDKQYGFEIDRRDLVVVRRACFAGLVRGPRSMSAKLFLPKKN